MASVFLRRRATKAGKVRWAVCYRSGGREAPERWDSVWPSKALAELRRERIYRAWAVGEPAPPIGGVPPEEVTIADVLTEYAQARLDVGPQRQATYRQTALHLGRIGGMHPGYLKPADVRGWVGELQRKLGAQSIRMHLTILRQVLDHAEVMPNPARHPSVRPPKMERKQITPPTNVELAALMQAITPRHRFALRVIEATGLRVSELQRLTWGDVDVAQGRIRVVGSKTHAARRWVPLEDQVLEELVESCPHEDRRAGRPVVPGFNDQTFRQALARASRDAGTVTFSPHDLRHRYISLLVHAGVPAPIIGQIVGHARSSVTLDTYSHVMVDECPTRLAELRRISLEAAAGWAAARAANVRTLAEARRARKHKNPAQGGVSVEVEDTGIEPVTFALPARRSPS